ncbi:XopX family type III secretion system effector [Xanthomonas translucens]|uniref:XopX family type III secretion system effector n=1 Tax=Xanthomonas campestris pv. translucens TaxID=343 RepID=UPI000B20F481|nr:XopX family type III secretion system effector [Xanthomonas translucens]MCT8280788.1 type III secretion system effector protein [Xanthomonas translucens pv. undulosa]MCT8315605.1 type III secretion system effector protein [Xanthomonas translucens pv. undulosa]WLA14893.1 type III secretion system effector protein [Xanthomonas translucens]
MYTKSVSASSGTSPPEIPTEAAHAAPHATTAPPTEAPVAGLLAERAPRRSGSDTERPANAPATPAQTAAHAEPATPQDSGDQAAASSLFHARALLAAGAQRVTGAASHAAQLARSAFESGKSGIVSAAKQVWTMSDLRTMLQVHAHDPEFLRILRGSDPEQPSAHTLASCRKQMQQLRTLCNASPDMPQHLRSAILSDIQAVEKALDPLEKGTPASGRALKSLVNLVNAWPLLVPSPLLANQAKTFAYSIAGATKGVLGLSMSALRSTADGLPFPLAGGQLGREANEMHFYAALLNGIFLATELPKKFGSESVKQKAEAIDNSLYFRSGAAVAAAAVLVTPFVWNNVKQIAGRARDGAMRMAADGAELVGRSDWAKPLHDRLDPVQVSEELRTSLNQIWLQLENGRAAFEQSRRNFTEDGGRELTSTLNSQCTHLLETLHNCTERFSGALGLDHAEAGIAPRGAKNSDFSSKLALTLLGAGVTGSTVFFIQPDKIGTADLVADSLVVTAVMAQSAWNKQATRQDAMERFKAMSAVSMVMALALGADKFSKAFTPNGIIESSQNSPYYAGLVMTLMSMTMPGPVARGAELAMNWVGGKILGQCTDANGTTLGTREAQTVQELQEHMASVQEHVAGLNPEQLEQYEEQVGANVQNLIANAGIARQTARTSGVTISEIEEEEPTPPAHEAGVEPAATHSPTHGASQPG